VGLNVNLIALDSFFCDKLGQLSSFKKYIIRPIKTHKGHIKPLQIDSLPFYIYIYL